VTIGGLVIARLVPPHRRERLVVPLVVLSLVPILAAGIVAVVTGPGALPFAAVVALLFVSGLGAAWLIPLNVSFVQAVPSAYRGRAFGVAVSGLYGVQALGALGAGLGAEGVSASAVLAVSGGLGLLAVAPALLAYRRTEGSVAAPSPGEGPSTA
jgi:MFS family permease